MARLPLSFCAGILLLCAQALAQSVPEWIPTGQEITPTAAPGSHFMALDPALPIAADWRLGYATNALLSPDGKTLLVVTAGLNALAGTNGEPVPGTVGDFILVYDVTAAEPRRIATLTLPASFGGLIFAPDSRHFYATTGVADSVQPFALGESGWGPDGMAIPLGHSSGNGVAVGDTKPLAAGIALLPDGKRLAVANRMNDSISIIDIARRKIISEVDLRPGGGKAGGTSPVWVVATGPDQLAVSSQRDRELVTILLDDHPHVIGRIALKGVPNRAIADRDGKRVFVAEDNADLIEIFDVATGNRQAAIATVPTSLSQGRRPRGVSPNSLTLSPDERSLYVTDAGLNAVAVIDLAHPAHGPKGLIPTGWYPTAVAASKDQLWVVNGKSNAGPNRRQCAQIKRLVPQGDCARPDAGILGNQYILQLTRAGLLSLPLPDPATLARLTRQTLRNASLDRENDRDAHKVMAFLQRRIRHIIYVVKENRTYDQVLGDLPHANGDALLTQFPRAITPNQHALAAHFVTLDNFRVSGEVSGDGWQWSTAARATDANEKLVHIYYARKGGGYDSEGTERNINVALPKIAARREANPTQPDDDNLLPGSRNSTEVDGPEDERGLGYIWDAARRARKSVRNYGFFLDLYRYSISADKGGIPVIEDPAARKSIVAYAANATLAPVTDPYFRGFDNNLPDLFRVREWQREFKNYERTGTLPALSLVRLMNDHMGDFATAIRGVNTPETQQADNDYALGLLVETIAHSRFANSTLIVALEDDAQDGPDHVDAHRSIAFVAGPYVRQHDVVSTRYTTIDMLRTIEAVLGLKPNNLFDAHARLMTDLFDIRQKPHWDFVAEPADILYSTQLPLPARRTTGAIPQPGHDATWWAAATTGFDWRAEDRNDAARFNAILAKGLNKSVSR